VEASALNQPLRGSAFAGRSPLLRLQGDEKLVALSRKGQDGAFDALVQRYESRLLAFCRHMLGSREDAEDILQEVFAAAYNAMLADERYINVRPWLYRIARNRCLNHLRRPTSTGLDSMDIFERDGGTSTADTVHKREEFRQIVSDVQDLPETQRTALLLREIDALSYEQIAEAMDTTVPSVKSLLVRARVSLAEASEARLLSCAEVRFELGQVAEGLMRSSAPVRRHLRNCERCRVFRDEMKKTTRALAAIYPIGMLVLFKKLFLAKLGMAGGGGAAAGAGGGAAGAIGSGAGAGAFGAGGLGAIGAGATGMTAGAGAIGAGAVGGTASAIGAGAVAATAGGAAGGGIVSIGVGTAASKAAAGLAAAAIVTAGAVEVKNVAQPENLRRQAVTTVAPARAEVPPAARAAAELAEKARIEAAALAAKQAAEAAAAAATAQAEPVVAAVIEPTPAPVVQAPAKPVAEPAPKTQEDSSTATLPGRGEEGASETEGSTGAGADQYAEPDSTSGSVAPPGEPSSGSAQPGAAPAPPAGEPGIGSAPPGF